MVVLVALAVDGDGSVWPIPIPIPIPILKRRFGVWDCFVDKATAPREGRVLAVLAVLVCVWSHGFVVLFHSFLAAGPVQEREMVLEGGGWVST